MNIRIQPGAVLLYLSATIIVLTAVNVAVLYLKIVLDHDHVYGLVPLFDFNTEMNVPTMYSTFAILVASTLLAVIGYVNKKEKGPYVAWFGLAFIFLFLAIDEFTSLHERLQGPAGEVVEATGIFFHVWIVPYGIALLVFVIGYAKFLFSLPRETVWRFILSGSLFVGGAIGIEAMGGRHLEINGPDGLYYVMTTIEEFMEMAGIALFIYSLLSYIGLHKTGLKLTFCN